MELKREGITCKNPKKIPSYLYHLRLPEKMKKLAGKCTQAVGRNWKRKGSWENAKEMLEMEEQPKETKKNQTFPP